MKRRLEKFNLRELKAEVDKMKIISEATGTNGTQQNVTPGQRTQQADSTQEDSEQAPNFEGPAWLRNIKERQQRANNK